jgi:tRNA threonylcarbamoyladenosine biosynthesis protein TsaB
VVTREAVALEEVTRGVTLALDAAAGPGTIAVLREGAVIAERAVEMRSATEERFFPAVLEVLDSVGLGTRDLARVVAGAGPGSFTALRVVGAIAKGLCEGVGCPLFGVPSLALIPAGTAATRGGGRVVATLDALRGDRYAALVELDASGAVVAVEAIGLVAITALGAHASALGATLIGPDEANAAAPHARGVARCWSLLAAAGPADLASWEPVYGRLAEAQVKWEATHGRLLVSERHAT